MMNVRDLGNTGLQVTRLGLGLAALGRPGYINVGHAEDLGHQYDTGAMQQHAGIVLDAAWEAGIRYFDAARSYGRAEAFLGAWLASRAISPSAVTVGSKWGYVYTADWQVHAEVHEVKHHDVQTLRQQYQESRQNLNGFLGLYQIHSATLESGVLENEAVLAQLGSYRDQGLAIGLTLSGAEQARTLARALQVEVGGRPLFGCVQATWNLLERSAGPALAAAHERGLGVIVKEALANGRLTEKNRDPGFASRLALLEKTAASQGTSVDALALASVLAQPWADVVLSGAATREQILSNVAALDVRWSPQIEEQLAELVEPPEAYWATRKALPWG